LTEPPFTRIRAIMTTPDTDADADLPSFDAATRRLCPDGSCIGVLDEEGRCPVCLSVAGEEATPASPGLGPEAFAGGCTTDEPGPDPEGAEATAFEPGSRRLCPDGACIGVLGPEGRCGVCGQTEAG
jgi:hypothetical protein